ncbi:MAG: type II toxin-antitoxin system RelE/ParE family toxin [Brevundimonas sp.]|uniref:type II toxin-antitoxin system RelE/ParE family toxin n=1 Tax=Brevundimonas sp. TaxID=1871086 RepID=UPI00391B49EB
MRRLIWAPRALVDLIEIQVYLNGFNPSAARRFFIMLKAAGDSLNAFPERGRPIGKGRRELTIIPPYVIRYRVTDVDVRILSVRHGARRPKP